jgi:hypothetical protein
MYTRTFWRSLALVTVTAALSACVDDRPTGPGEPNRALAASSDADTISPPPKGGDFYPGEEEFLKKAYEIPGYAGDWYEGDTRVVALTDMAQEGRARQVLAASFADAEPTHHDESKTGGGTEFVKAEFDFLSLRKWRDSSADPVLDIKGTTFIDLDENANRVTVGIADESHRAEVQDRLKKSGVPLEATEIVVSGELEEAVTLQQYVRPLMGGLQIQNQNGGICTLGFITRNPANGANAFVTNSHCTGSYWANDGIAFHQPLAPNFVGREVRDPGGFACGFFWLWRCRYSDAALVQVSGASVAQGQIARTAFAAYGFGPSGSLTISGTPMNVSGVQNYPFMGQLVDKVGRTSGWTYGPVRRTCVTTSVGGWKRLLCQYFAYYTSIPGDSGSPVFLYYGSNVVLAGINWGYSPSERLAVFSPAGGIRNDLAVP